MTKRTTFVAVLISTASLRAQAPTPAKPQFEVASVRRIGVPAPGELRPAGCAATSSSPGRLTICTNLASLIRNADAFYANGRRDYSSMPAMVEGGPNWIASELYAFGAKATDDASAEMMQGPLMQALLEDRFQLKLHREVRQVSVYELTVAKNDSKLRAHQSGNCTPYEPGKPQPTPGPGEKPACKGGSMSRGPQKVTVTGEFFPMNTFASGIWGIGGLDRPVVNKTGLTFLFDVKLEFMSAFVTATDDPALPSVFTAVEEQLGLRLEPSKGPQEFLVIDHIERPSEN